MEIKIQVGHIFTNLETNIYNSMQEMGEKALEEARYLCPVDTGRLKESLKVKTERINKTRVDTTLSTNVKYAPYVEFGTGIRGTGSYPYEQELGLGLKYGFRAGQVAQPYMYPAAKKAVGEITNVFTKE